MLVVYDIVYEEAFVHIVTTFYYIFRIIRAYSASFYCTVLCIHNEMFCAAFLKVSMLLLVIYTFLLEGHSPHTSSNHLAHFR